MYVDCFYFIPFLYVTLNFCSLGLGLTRKMTAAYL